MNLPQSPIVICKFVSARREISRNGKLCYVLDFRVDEGEYTGLALTRTLWMTDKGQRYLQQDCRTLNAATADDLLRLRPGSVRVQGGLMEEGRGGYSLRWLEPVSVDRRPGTTNTPSEGKNFFPPLDASENHSTDYSGTSSDLF